MIGDVYGAGHQEQPEALPCLLLQKDNRQETPHKTSKQRYVLLPFLRNAPPQRAENGPEDQDKTADEEPEISGVLTGEYLDKVAGRFEDPLDPEDSRQPSLDQIAKKGNLSTVLKDGLNASSFVLAGVSLRAGYFEHLEYLLKLAWQFYFLLGLGLRVVIDELMLLHLY